MKELTIKEKAKRYDEAKFIMEKYLKSGNAGVIAENTIKKAFPELAESEDERIRNGLLSHLRELREYKGTNPPIKTPEHYSAWVAWLEKQGKTSPVLSNSSNIGKVEQKPDDKVEPKFKVGDVVINKKSKDTVKIVQILHDSYCYSGWDGAATVHSDFSISEQDDWELVEQKPAEWNTNDEQILNSAIKDLIHPCYEEIPDRIEEEIKWIKSMRNRVVSQPKQEWSEEDEEIHRKCICAMRASACGFPEEEKFVEQVDNWLKFLKERYSWKPSDEQMECLDNVKGSDDHNGYVLNTLYNDLKKLKDEK